MTWTKLSDDFGDDCYQLSDAAFRLHVEGLLWSNRKLVDLKLDKAVLQRWATRPEAAAELVDRGWWTDEGDHYLIRHHAIYQRTAEQVVKQQQANKANRAKGKARPVREQAPPASAETTVSDESSDESSDEMDRTGQDRTGHLEEGVKQNGSVQNGSGPSPLHCKFCDTELEPGQRNRGYCSDDACLAEAW